MSVPQGSRETMSEYKARILGYQAGADALVLQEKAQRRFTGLGKEHARLERLQDGLDSEQIRRVVVHDEHIERPQRLVFGPGHGGHLRSSVAPVPDREWSVSS